RRRMYDREVDDPRLHRRYEIDRSFQAGALPHRAGRALAEIRETLECHYHVAFRSVALNYYRDGRDSVAFHRDRELRHLDDTLVIIVTLGSRRPFLIRPLDRSQRSIDLAPASGDLLVMGGTCQQAWEHCVPKVVHAGPRISVSLRWARAPF
ncbi:MAG TPA: alpha-ketoglutarate-dependent dioxygenase AlkB, partial [Acidimicrobiia bacterium]